MSARPSRLAACATVLVALTASSALAQARIDAVEGKVEVAPAGMKVWIAVSSPPYSMKEGDRVRTAPGASASIVFPDNSRVQLTAESAFTAERIRKGDAAMRLDAGTLHAWVTKALSRHFRVTTSAAVAQARGTAFGVEVTLTKDTQVEVDEGVVAVTLKNGEETTLGTGCAFRSLLVVPGRPLGLLPHPHEDAGGKKSARKKSVDCLHAPNGALRGSVEEIEACQERARAKAGVLSPAEELALREQAREEIKRFLTATGELPGGEADPGQAADGGDGQNAGGGKRDVAAETASLMKEAGLSDGAAASPLASMSPEKIKMLQDALARQHASPAIQAAFSKAAGGGQLSGDELQGLLKGLNLDKVDLNPTGKAAPPP